MCASLCFFCECVNDDFPKNGYLQLVLGLHVWMLLPPLERNNLEFFQRDVLGTQLGQQKWEWELRQLSPLTVLMSHCLRFWSHNILCLQVPNTLKTLPPGEGMLDLMGVTSLGGISGCASKGWVKVTQRKAVWNCPRAPCAKLAWALHCQF